jgi:hypothetical protein
MGYRWKSEKVRGSRVVRVREVGLSDVSSIRAAVLVVSTSAILSILWVLI